MKNTIKKILALSVALSLSGCSLFFEDEEYDYESRVYADHPNEEFTKYLEQLVIDEASADFTTMHDYFEHPENYGIDVDEVEVNLGYIINDEDTEEELEEELYEFDYESLDKTQQNIYDQLDFNFQLSDKLDKEEYEYIQNIWGGMNGLPQILVTYFSEYIVRSEDDIGDLVTLINDVPRYVDEAFQYLSKQADLDLMYVDIDSVLEFIQTVLDTKEDSAILHELYDEVDQLNLDVDKSDAYKQKIHDAFYSSFIPTYEKMKTELPKYKSKNHELTGLANIKGGKPYYELVVQDATGSTESIEEIRDNLEENADMALSSLQLLARKKYSAVENMYNIDTGFTSVEEIIPFLLSKYTKDFEDVGKLDYDLNPLSDEQSQEGIVAYFINPAIDNTTTHQIRYNKRDYGDDPSSIDLYTTLAHEGIPGHMYQAAFNNKHYEYPIQYMLGCLGLSEGYATYVQFQTLNYLNCDKDTLKAYKYNEILTDFYICLMDISIHYDGLSYEEFVDEYSDLFGTDLKGLYDQLAENPATFLSYYYGYLQINDLKNEAKDYLGDDFNNKDFNTALLESGEVNFNIVRRSIYEYMYE